MIITNKTSTCLTVWSRTAYLKLSKNRNMFCYFECKNAGFQIYKNVHNVQNFVYNYKNKYFDSKSAWNPYIYWIWYFVTVSWQNNYKVLAKVWFPINLGICGLFEPLFDNRCPREKNTQKSKLLLDKAIWQRYQNSNFCILIFACGYYPAGL